MIGGIRPGIIAEKSGMIGGYFGNGGIISGLGILLGFIGEKSGMIGGYSGIRPGIIAG